MFRNDSTSLQKTLAETSVTHLSRESRAKIASRLERKDVVIESVPGVRAELLGAERRPFLQ
jgi:hypothetical protein